MERKNFYGYFKRQTGETSYLKTRTLLQKENLKRETEFLLTVVQSNSIRTNHISAKIDNTQENNKCRSYGNKNKTINPISVIKLAKDV